MIMTHFQELVFEQIGCWICEQTPLSLSDKTNKVTGTKMRAKESFVQWSRKRGWDMKKDDVNQSEDHWL